MRKLLWPIVVTMLMAMVVSAVGMARTLYAQENPRLASVVIEIWPEFDHPAAALVIIRGELASNVPLPATLTLRIPASSGGPSAVASAPSKGDPPLTQNYQLASAENSLLLTLTTPNRLFQVEFYEPLSIDTPDRNYTYVWPGDLGADQLSVLVLEPAGATGLVAKPELQGRSVGPDGLVYRTGQMGPLGIGETRSIEVSYRKTDPRTSVEILDPGAAKSNGRVTAAWLLPVAIAALAVTLGAIAYWRWGRQRTAVAAGIPQGAQRRGRRAGEPPGTPASGPFCTRCGNRLHANERFCSQCGTRVAGQQS